jgi:hypothetical protein
MIERCLEQNPADRPTSKELANTWKAIINFKKGETDKVMETIDEIEDELIEQNSLDQALYVDIFKSDMIVKASNYD